MFSFQSRRLELLGAPPFRWFVISCVLATFGGGLGYVAMSWLVLKSNNSVAAVVILMFCFWAPSIVLGPFAGVIADRYSRKSLTVLSNGIRALLLIGFSSFLNGPHAVLLIYMLMFFLGIFFSIYFPAAQALLREIVAPEDLLHANSVLDIAYEVGSVAGMGSAGLFVAWFSVPTAILFNGIIFVGSTVSLALVTVQFKNQFEDQLKSRFFEEFSSGFRYLWQRPELMIIYTMQLLVMVTFMTSPILLAPFSKNVLHATVGEFGAIGTSLSFGIIVGGILIPWVAERFGLTKSLVSMFALMAMSFGLFAMNRNLSVAMALYFLAGFGSSIWPVIVTQAQKITLLTYQGRVQSVFNSLAGVIILSVYLLVDLSSHYISLQQLYGFEVLFSLVGLVILWRYHRILSSAKEQAPPLPV